MPPVRDMRRRDDEDSFPALPSPAGRHLGPAVPRRAGRWGGRDRGLGGPPGPSREAPGWSAG